MCREIPMTLTNPIRDMIEKANLPSDVRSNLMDFFRTNRPTAVLAEQIDTNKHLKLLVEQIIEIEDQKLRSVGEAMAEFEQRRQAEQIRSASRTSAKVARIKPLSPGQVVSTVAADEGVARAGG